MQVVLFKFGKKETTGEIPCLEIPIIYEVNQCFEGSEHSSSHSNIRIT